MTVVVCLYVPRSNQLEIVYGSIFWNLLITSVTSFLTTSSWAWVIKADASSSKTLSTSRKKSVPKPEILKVILSADSEFVQSPLRLVYLHMHRTLLTQRLRSIILFRGCDRPIYLCVPKHYLKTIEPSLQEKIHRQQATKRDPFSSAWHAEKEGMRLAVMDLAALLVYSRNNSSTYTSHGDFDDRSKLPVQTIAASLAINDIARALTDFLLSEYRSETHALCLGGQAIALAYINTILQFIISDADTHRKSTEDAYANSLIAFEPDARLHLKSLIQSSEWIGDLNELAITLRWHYSPTFDSNTLTFKGIYEKCLPEDLSLRGIRYITLPSRPTITLVPFDGLSDLVVLRKSRFLKLMRWCTEQRFLTFPSLSGEHCRAFLIFIYWVSVISRYCIDT